MLKIRLGCFPNNDRNCFHWECQRNALRDMTVMVLRKTLVELTSVTHEWDYWTLPMTWQLDQVSSGSMELL